MLYVNIILIYHFSFMYPYVSDVVLSGYSYRSVRPDNSKYLAVNFVLNMYLF